MRVLIVEDSRINAFCLTRLLETIYLDTIQVVVVENSAEALLRLSKWRPDLLVLDGDLGASEGESCNGPVLADLVWRKIPNQAIIAWTDNEAMRKKFKEVFKQYQKPFNGSTLWPKMISQKSLQKSLSDLSLTQDVDRWSNHNAFSAFHLERLYA